MVQLGNLQPDGRVTNQREISQSDILACPHAILMVEHYRDDGSCRCNDPDHCLMSDWGYTWDDGRWIAGDEPDDDADDSAMPTLFIPTSQADIDNPGEGAIPYIGDTTPDGWKWIETLLVDSSGWGRDDEPALTLDQFKKAMQIGRGYAIVDVGQFQVQVGVFERIKVAAA